MLNSPSSGCIRTNNWLDVLMAAGLSAKAELGLRWSAINNGEA